MGYKFQFVTLAGFHALNLSMWELAREYKQQQMGAYTELQEREFAAELDGYGAVKHQSYVGAGYFDEITSICGAASMDWAGTLSASRNICSAWAARSGVG